MATVLCPTAQRVFVSHILLVDDEPDALRELGLFLERRGYAVSMATDGEAALASFARHPADVVITDLRMPRRDGESLMRELRAREPGLPIIVITGVLPLADEDPELIDQFEGLTRWVLRKPLSFQELTRCLQEALPGQVLI